MAKNLTLEELIYRKKVLINDSIGVFGKSKYYYRKLEELDTLIIEKTREIEYAKTK